MKKVIIVGAGIAGLSAGVYARQSGFDVTIYEAHTIPGGASTSWKRGGYLFEGGMHWLTGSSPKNTLNRLWREVGALDGGVEIYNRDPFFSYEENGKFACLYRDIAKLKAHLLELSHEDKKEINQLCNDLKKFGKMGMPVTDIKGVKVLVKAPSVSVLSMLPAVGRMAFYSKQSVDEYAKRYKGKLIQKLFLSCMDANSSATALIFTLATLTSGDGGYPSGGSLGMANRIAKKFVKLGGEIQYNTFVEKVSVTNGVATGVIVGGKVIKADAVVVAQDTFVAIDKMFDTPIKDDWAEKMRKETTPTVCTFVSLGIKADLSDLPEQVVFNIEKPILCGGQEINGLGINNYATYKGYAPANGTALTCTIMGDSYDWWKEQKKSGGYDAEKQKLAEAIIDCLSKKYPQIVGKVEVWDVATPLTYERYLHSYKGSWMSNMDKNLKMPRYPSKPEEMSNVYFAGQRLMPPGGLPGALVTGREAIQYLCLDTDTVFQGGKLNP